MGVEREDGEAKGPAFLPPHPQAAAPAPYPRLFASPSPWTGAGKDARASAYQLVRADCSMFGNFASHLTSPWWFTWAIVGGFTPWKLANATHQGYGSPLPARASCGAVLRAHRSPLDVMRAPEILFTLGLEGPARCCLSKSQPKGKLRLRGHLGSLWSSRLSVQAPPILRTDNSGAGQGAGGFRLKPEGGTLKVDRLALVTRTGAEEPWGP